MADLFAFMLFVGLFVLGVVFFAWAFGEIQTLRAALRRLEERLAALETRALSAKSAEERVPQPSPAAPPRSLSAEPPTPPSPPPSGPVSGPVSAPPPKPSVFPSAEAPASAQTEDLEQRIGLSWLNRVGALLVLAGAVFFLKYSFEQGWISPAMRVGLGFAAAVASLAASERMRRRGFARLAEACAGLGFGLAYAADYAGFRLYALYGAGTTLSVAAAVGAAAVAWALWRRSGAAAWLAAAGGYLAPFFLGGGALPPGVLALYVFVLTAALAATAWEGRRQGLAWAAAAGGYFVPLAMDWNQAPLVAFLYTLALSALLIETALRRRWPALIVALAAFAPLGGTDLGWNEEALLAWSVFLLFHAGLALAAGYRSGRFSPWWGAWAGLYLPLLWKGLDGVFAQRETFSLLFAFLVVAQGVLLAAMSLPSLLEGRRTPRMAALGAAGSALAFFGTGLHLLDWHAPEWKTAFALASAALFAAAGETLRRRRPTDETLWRFFLLQALAFFTLAFPLELSGRALPSHGGPKRFFFFFLPGAGVLRRLPQAAPCSPPSCLQDFLEEKRWKL